MPRHVPATAHELGRVELFADLPGERLRKLAERMLREEVPGGEAPVIEGEAGDRFYVILSGIFAVTNIGALGPRRVLRPGDYFGEVALAMDMPRTASVRALTHGTVASADRETFDEFIRPLFADDG
jgi:CRP-like cAMP-binding protein